MILQKNFNVINEEINPKYSLLLNTVFKAFKTDLQNNDAELYSNNIEQGFYIIKNPVLKVTCQAINKAVNLDDTEFKITITNIFGKSTTSEAIKYDKLVKTNLIDSIKKRLFNLKVNEAADLGSLFAGIKNDIIARKGTSDNKKEFKNFITNLDKNIKAISPNLSTKIAIDDKDFEIIINSKFLLAVTIAPTKDNHIKVTSIARIDSSNKKESAGTYEFGMFLDNLQAEYNFNLSNTIKTYKEAIGKIIEEEPEKAKEEQPKNSTEEQTAKPQDAENKSTEAQNNKEQKPAEELKTEQPKTAPQNSSNKYLNMLNDKMKTTLGDLAEELKDKRYTDALLQAQTPQEIDALIAFWLQKELHTEDSLIYKSIKPFIYKADSFNNKGVDLLQVLLTKNIAPDIISAILDLFSNDGNKHNHFNKLIDDDNLLKLCKNPIEPVYNQITDKKSTSYIINNEDDFDEILDNIQHNNTKSIDTEDYVQVINTLLAKKQIDSRHDKILKRSIELILNTNNQNA